MSFLGDLFKIVAIGAFFIATGPFGLTVSAGLATALRIGGFVASYIGSMIDRPNRLQQKQRYDMQLDPGVPIPVIYGRAKVGGIVADWFVDKTTNDKILYMAVVVAHGSRDGLGISSVEQIWFNGQLAITTSGDVRRTPYAPSTSDYQILLGTTTQNAGTTVLSGISASLTAKSFSQVSGYYEEAAIAILTSSQVDQKITTAVSHGYTTGDRIRITGHVGSAPNLNHTFVITVTSATQFTLNDFTILLGGTSGSAIRLTSSVPWSATTDTGRGLALVLFRFLNVPNKETEGPTFQGPPSIAFIVNGNRVYDTRDDTWYPGGSNPAMCIRDYLLSEVYGCGFPTSMIEETSFQTAADYCDATATHQVGWHNVSVVSSSVANPSVITCTAAHFWSTGDTVRIAGHTGSTPSINSDYVITVTGDTTFTIPVNVTVGGTGGTVNRLRVLSKRYTCNGVLDTSRSTIDNLQELLSSCRGQLVWQQGQFSLTIRNGSPPASAVTLSPANILGEWSFRNAGLEDKWNLIRASYVEPLNGLFKAVDVQWPRYGTTNSYLVADNSFQNRLDLSLPFTNDHLMAQTIAQITMNEARLGISAQCRCTEELLAATVGDRVSVTHPTPGWTAKDFWITALQVFPDTSVGVSLQEFDTTAYDLTTMSDVRTFLPTDHDSIFDVPAVGAVTCDAITGGGVRVSWPAAAYGQIDFYEVQAKCKSCGDDYVTIARVRPSDSLEAVDPLARAGQTWSAQVRIVNVVGWPGDWSISSDTALPADGALTPRTGSAIWTGLAPTVVVTTTPCDLTAVNRSDSGGDLCNDATGWIQTVGWTVTSPDDAHYQIDIDIATNSAGNNWTSLITGLTTVSSTYDNNTGIWCKLDPPGTITTYYRKYRVKLMLKVFGTEIEHLDTTQDTISCRSGTCP